MDLSLKNWKTAVYLNKTEKSFQAWVDEQKTKAGKPMDFDEYKRAADEERELCPFCRDKTVAYRNEEQNGSTYSVFYRCMSCYRDWAERYVLSGVDEIFL